MSRVLWYSVVAFQWRNVWKVICLIRTFFSLAAILFRCLLKFLLIKSEFLPNNVSVSLGMSASILASLIDIGRILGLLPFSGVILIVRCCKSISVHFSSPHASPLRAPVSFNSCRKVATFLLQAAMSWSNSHSVQNARASASTRTNRLFETSKIQNTKAGFEATVYELIARAYLGLMLDSISLENLLNRIDKDSATEILAATAGLTR